MTIRLRCTQCQRKLKVPDAALGKKIQCPTCGARFIGQIEPSTPPPTPQPEASPPPVERTPTPGPAAAEASLLDYLFADMAAHSFGPSTVPMPQAAPTFTPLVLGHSAPKAAHPDGEIIETISLEETDGTEGTAPTAFLSSFVAGSKLGTPERSDTDSGDR